MATRPVHVVSREVPPEFQLRMAVAIGVVCAAFALIAAGMSLLLRETRGRNIYHELHSRR